MKTLIIYTSRTGFTKKYVDYLSSEIDADVKELSGDINVSGYDTIIFASWIYAARLKKLIWLDNHNLENKNVIVLAVGITNQPCQIDVFLEDIEARGYKAFFLTGGLDYNRLGFIDKRVIKMISKSYLKEVNISIEDEIYAKKILTSFDDTNKEQLQPVINYLTSL